LPREILLLTEAIRLGPLISLPLFPSIEPLAVNISIAVCKHIVPHVGCSRSWAGGGIRTVQASTRDVSSWEIAGTLSSADIASTGTVLDSQGTGGPRLRGGKTVRRSTRQAVLKSSRPGTHIGYLVSEACSVTLARWEL
jgi:hypothetical protein